jgi:hypothetical protein
MIPAIARNAISIAHLSHSWFGRVSFTGTQIERSPWPTSLIEIGGPRGPPRSGERSVYPLKTMEKRS